MFDCGHVIFKGCFGSVGSSSQHHHLLKFGVEFPKLSGHSVQHNWPDGLVTECFALPPPSEVPPDIDIISSRAEHLHLLELDVSADVCEGGG